ncbi:MAG: aspartate--ammonia ligase, partial [Lachnospiraceae bacterium]|nr:aspartate--ammonia ligase [Lachnospiraceae bacterium]
MEHLIIPKDYQSPLTIRETEVAIKEIKDYFERALAKSLHLTRVSAPLFVKPESGLNDNLNGVERPVSFGIKEQQDKPVEIVHSLAKWKRYALKQYGFHSGEGLYTDMNAIRRDEDTDNIHSLYVDQWDWEKVISKEERNMETLEYTVRKVYAALKETEDFISKRYNYIEPLLPDEITFITSQELENLYPLLSSKEREYAIAKEKGAVFISQIGKYLASGEKHDGRAPDYDDWELNGDILVYYPVLDIALELSSMGIRVDEESLLNQLELSGCLERKELDFQKALLAH